MQPRRIRLALYLAALLTSAAPAQKTEVTVSRGKVKVEAAAGAVLVEPGQKGVLPQAGSPSVTVNEPLVQQLMQMSHWVDAERKASRIKIDYASIQIHSLEDHATMRVAILEEHVNRRVKPADTCRIGPTSLAQDLKYYDMEGHLLTYDLQKLSGTQGYYYVHFPKLVPTGGVFRFIQVSRYEMLGDLWRNDKLWYRFGANDTPNCLNYFMEILPKSAIFVDCSLPPMLIGQVDGRVAVTIRNYTGASADGHFQLSFIWPDKDGTTLTDLPGEYRGAPEASQQALADEYHRGMAKIRAGEAYEDQSTPLRALLTSNAGIIRRDKALFARCSPPGWGKHIDTIFQPANIKGIQAHNVDRFDFLSTPPWPDQPAERTIHLIYMSLPGSHMHAMTYGMAYLGGKWIRLAECWPQYSDVENFVEDVTPPSKAEARLDKLPWDKAGSEAVEVYNDFRDENISQAKPWTDLGIKLAGGQFWTQALDAFSRASALGGSATMRFAGRVWQGHMHDVLNQRDQAIACYKAALQMPDHRAMRHDQWGIVLTDDWVRQRLDQPFASGMIGESKPGGVLADLQSLPWDNAGPQALEVYKTFVKQNQQDPQFWGQLAIKLAGGGFWTESLDAFARCEKANPESMWQFTSLVWQGHLLDLVSQRDKAIEKYKAALEVDYGGTMRHDQWKMVIDKEWVKARLTEPFPKEMMGK